MIELINVSKYYNNNGVVALGLRNVNLKLSGGEIVAIVGESGSGKSTLLNVICGVDTYEEGEILFKGNETSYFNQDDMDNYRKQNVSFIYQNYNIIDSYTVLENIMLPLLINGLDAKNAKQKALELIDKVGLSHRIKHKGIKLSGGEKQRCVIARALASDSPILACDEPTGNLDSKTGEEIINLIKEVSKDKLVLIVTHNYEQVSDIVTRTIRVSDGEIVEDKSNTVIENSVNEKIDFSNHKVKNNRLFWISIRNILSTPKKNILSLAVFLVLSLIGFFLFLSCLSSSEESQYNSFEGFKNTVHNRLIVYDKNRNPLDMEKLSKIKGEIYKNALYEDMYYGVDFGEDAVTGILSYHLPKNIDVVSGTTELKEKEMFIVLPLIDAYLLETIDSKIDSNIELALPNVHNYKLKGVATSKEISLPLFVIKDEYLSDLNYYLIKSIENVKVNNKEIKSVVTSNYRDFNSVTYYSPNKMDNIEIELILKDLYGFKLLDEYEYTWVQSNDERIEILLKDFTINETFEATIYADDLSDAIKAIEDAGYLYFQPAKSGYNKFSFSFVLFVLYTALSCIAMLVLTFIAYIILARIYSSKNKDYTILRSLGLVKKQLAKIVDFEVLIIGFVGSVLALVIYYVISIFNIQFKYMLTYNSVWFMILYFMLMLMFSYIISRRFNRKLFKFSISTSIKDEVE